MTNATGFDTALNNIARNTILLVDPVEQTSSNSWALKLPNAWVGEFEGYWASGASGNIDFNFYNNQSSGTNGYTLSMDDTTIVVKYDGSTKQTTTLSSTLKTGVYRKISIFFERDTISVSIDGKKELHFKDTALRARVYDDQAGGYITVSGLDSTSNIMYEGSGLKLGLDTKTYVGDGVVREFNRHDRPLTKYPEVAMTGDSSGGGYTVTSSSRESSTHAAYKAFNDLNEGNYTTSFTTGFNTFSSGLAAVSRTTGSDTFNHEWIELNLPKRIHLKEIDVYRRGPDANNANQPKTGRVYGSNDGSTYDLLFTYSGLTYNGYTTPTKVINPNTTKQYYKIYRFVISEMYTGDRVSIGEMDFWGHEEGDESVDVVHRSVPNKPGQQQLAVYWDANDTTSYSGSGRISRRTFKTLFLKQKWSRTTENNGV